MSRTYTHLTASDYAHFAQAGLILSTRFFVPTIRTCVSIDANEGYICLTGVGCEETEDFSGIRKVIQGYFDVEILEQPQQVDDVVSCLIRAKGANVSKVSDFIGAVEDGFSEIRNLDIEYEGEEPPQNLLSRSFSEKTGVSWRNLEIQRNVGGPKERYELGLDYIKKSGFERYLELTEQFGLVFDIFEGRVPEEFYRIFFQEIGSYEWTQSAWEISPDGNILISYRRVAGLRFQEYVRGDGSVCPFYLTPDFRYSEKNGISSGSFGGCCASGCYRWESSSY